MPTTPTREEVHWCCSYGDEGDVIECGGVTLALHDYGEPDSYRVGEPRSDLGDRVPADAGPIIYTLSDSPALVTCEECLRGLLARLAWVESQESAE